MAIESVLRQRRSHWLPVFHTLAPGTARCRPSDALCTDPHFYYLATGCSDLHVRASNGTMVVGRNRADAVLQLLGHRFGLSQESAAEMVGRDVQKRASIPPGAVVNVCGLNASEVVKAWAGLNTCAMARREQRGQLGDPDLRQMQCIHRSRPHVGLLSAWLLRLLFELRMSTAVLLHEAPGSAPPGAQSAFLWKTEIVRARPYTDEAFFAFHARAAPAYRRCDLPGARGGLKCLYCGSPDAQTPLTKRACLGGAAGHMTGSPPGRM
jgi:hypothetical protein